MTFPATYYRARIIAAERAVALYFRDRNNCRASAAYHRDCIRDAIHEVRTCRAKLEN